MVTVALVGSGPAADAVAATLADADATVDRRDAPPLDADLGVVVDRVGADTFECASDDARDAETPWLAVEIGGVGGYPLTDAAVTGFAPGGACYDCLRTRVASNVDPESDPVEAPDAPVQRVAGAVAGREAAAWLDGEAAFGRVHELPHAERSLLPVPGCDCGAAPDRQVRLDHEDASTEAALARAERGLDERVGIATQVGEVHSYPAPYYLAQLCDTGEFSDARAPDKAAGVAVDWNVAFMKALGEAYERYAAGVYRRTEARTAAAGDLDGAVPPAAFVRPDDAAEPDELAWYPGTTLTTGGDCWLPADLVRHPPASRDLRPPVTTGLGLGASGADALVAGLTEVIERDAAMLSWYSTYDPLELAVDDGGFETLAARAGSEGLSVTPLLLTQDVDVPVVAVAVHRAEWPRFAVGSAAALDPAAAARGALAEAVQNWMELRDMGPEGAAGAGGAIGEYADFPERAQAFVDAEGPVPADSVGPDEVPDGAAAVDALVERLADAGLDAHAARLTTRDLETLGFEAVRVLVPAAQPLFLEEPFFGERAASVPRDLGFEPRLDRPFHPFP